MPWASAIFIKAVEQATGESIDRLRALSIEERRAETEARCGSKLRFTSKFPFIGRGNVLRDRAITHEEVEAALDKALK